MATDAVHRFAPFVAALGRGQGRSRGLTRDEAREAFGMVLRGEPDPHQVGAFLMLLRYRGEGVDEVAGLVEAARAGLDGEIGGAADLDWPSYGSGRTRELPWFLLAGLALARSGIRVLMHGSNAFSSGVPAGAALQALGMSPASNPPDAARLLQRDRFAYLPLERLSAPIDRLLGMRALFGLRSPVNTVARLLDPAAAHAGIDGVFHPAYIDVHLGVAERLGRPRLLVLKGGGGEAERNPAKPLAAHLWAEGAGRSELLFPAWAAASKRPASGADPALLAALWRREARHDEGEAIVLATVGAALLAAGRAATTEDADRAATDVWAAR